jgi:hypothetical protein
MGIQVEFNPDLALRNFSEYTKGNRKQEECIPESLTKGKSYSFLKKRQRFYWLHGELPLLETKGEGKLSLPLASITIDTATHALIDDEVWTKGTYTVTEVFSDTTPHFNGFAKV